MKLALIKNKDFETFIIPPRLFGRYLYLRFHHIAYHKKRAGNKPCPSRVVSCFDFAYLRALASLREITFFAQDFFHAKAQSRKGNRKVRHYSSSNSLPRAVL